MVGNAERVKTGIPGLDEIMHGGVPPGQTVLVSGTAGSGKTILATQFLYAGATKYKENGVYLSFEEPPDSIRKNSLNFGWDIGALERQEKLSFVKYDPYHVDDVVNHLEGRIREMAAKRVVIDSVTALSFYLREDMNFRRMLFNLYAVLQKLDCTTFMLSEVPPGSTYLSRHSVAEFVSDSVIVLYYARVASSFTRAVQVWKMRGSSHSERLHPYKITDQGVVVYPKEEAFLEPKHGKGF